MLREPALEAHARAGQRAERGCQRAVDRLGHPAEHRVPGRADDRTVERDVGVVVELLAGRIVPRARCRELHAGERLRQALERRGRRPLRREARRLDLEDAPALEVLAQHLGRPRAAEESRQHVGVEAIPVLLGPHDRAVSVPHLHEPPFLETAEALPHDAVTHVEAAGDVGGLGQQVALAVPACRDLSDQNPHRTAVKARHRMS